VLPNTSRGGSGVIAAAWAGAAAALGVALFWGFTVDDAWVTARVAWRLASGLGYRFNAAGPPVDAVTPLGWVYALVPFAGRSPAEALQFARYSGAVVWILAAAWFGSSARRAGKNPYYVIGLFAAAPLGAWSSAGMETGFIVALSTLALGESLGAALATAIAAALRPELIPFCVILALRWIEPKKSTWARCYAPLLLTLGLPIAVAIIRNEAFGRCLPLSALAKPSDVFHGLRYGLGVLLFLGPTWLWLGPGWKALNRKERVIALSVVIHLLAIILVGGDWMPLWRLALPAMPAALWVATCLQSSRRPFINILGLSAAMSFAAYVGVQVGVPGRHVTAARAALIEKTRPLLRGSRRVAALDIGWLGEAYSGDIVDLAGITDPRVAALPGGHTSKRFQNSWFDSTQPDALVLLTAPSENIQRSWVDTTFARNVENRIKTMPYFQDCSLRGHVELQYTSQVYAIIRCQ
jgi:hypothetical protein